jgi:uncharacterized protein YuzE
MMQSDNRERGTMRATYDDEADAAMIYLVPIGPGEATGCHLSFPKEWEGKSHLTLDFNDANELIGIEILYASRVLPQQFLQEAEQISRRHRVAMVEAERRSNDGDE